MKGRITFMGISLCIALATLITIVACQQNSISFVPGGNYAMVLLMFSLNISANIFQIVYTIIEWIEEWFEQNKKKTTDELKHIIYEIPEDLENIYNQYLKGTTTEAEIDPPNDGGRD